jgi:predicted enzyme related to lactoylglutathione lyase
VEQLKADGVTFVDELVDSEYGKFIHLVDPEGNKIELFEPAG